MDGQAIRLHSKITKTKHQNRLAKTRKDQDKTAAHETNPAFHYAGSPLGLEQTERVLDVSEEGKDHNPRRGRSRKPHCTGGSGPQAPTPQKTCRPL